MKQFLFSLFVVFFAVQAVNAGWLDSSTTSDSGVNKVSAQVPVQANGLTVEQQNVKDRLAMDNKPGSIKYLYVISPYSGQCIMYSTVKGKVTSSGKRLNPREVMGGDHVSGSDMRVNIAGREYVTTEVIEDDGTYGDSCPYIFWWDTKGAYHQLFLTGAQMVSISDEPLPVKSVVINVSKSKSEE